MPVTGPLVSRRATSAATRARSQQPAAAPAGSCCACSLERSSVRARGQYHLQGTLPFPANSGGRSCQRAAPLEPAAVSPPSTSKHTQPSQRAPYLPAASQESLYPALLTSWEPSWRAVLIEIFLCETTQDPVQRQVSRS